MEPMLAGSKADPLMARAITSGGRTSGIIYLGRGKKTLQPHGEGPCSPWKSTGKQITPGSPWRALHQSSCWRNVSSGRFPMLEQGQSLQAQEEGTAEITCDKLTSPYSPFPIPLYSCREKGEKFGSKVKNRKKEGEGGKLLLKFGFLSD